MKGFGKSTTRKSSGKKVGNIVGTPGTKAPIKIGKR